MTKKFLKDNRGQVLYAVLVTVMFLGVLSMITMGLTLQHYHAAQQKQAHVTDYYAADAVAELIRNNKIEITVENAIVLIDIQNFEIASEGECENPVSVKKEGTIYTITAETVTLTVDIQGDKFTSWEVSYHAKQPAE